MDKTHPLPICCPCLILTVEQNKIEKETVAAHRAWAKLASSHDTKAHQQGLLPLVSNFSAGPTCTHALYSPRLLASRVIALQGLPLPGICLDGFVTTRKRRLYSPS